MDEQLQRTISSLIDTLKLTREGMEATNTLAKEQLGIARAVTQETRDLGSLLKEQIAGMDSAVQRLNKIADVFVKYYAVTTGKQAE